MWKPRAVAIELYRQFFTGSTKHSCFEFLFKVELLHIFLEQSYQWSFWLPLNHSERQKWMYSFRRSLIGLDSSPWFRGTETSFHKLSIGHKITMWKINFWTHFESFLSLKLLGESCSPIVPKCEFLSLSSGNRALIRKIDKRFKLSRLAQLSGSDVTKPDKN